MHLYLIKYTPEIGTKKRFTRSRFIRRLEKNIQAALQEAFSDSAAGKDYQLHADINRIELETALPVASLLTRIPGIKYFTRALRVEFSNEQELIEKAFQHFSDEVKSHDSYAVRSKRMRNPVVSTQRIERELGAALNPFGKVDLTNPGVTCFVEIRKQKAHFFSHKTEGMHGLPVGIEGKALTLLGGGIDSPVAAWKTYKVGIEQDFLYFDLDGQQKVKQSAYPIAAYLKNQYGYGSRSKLIEINFMPVIAEIMKVKPSFRNLALKYCFYYVGERMCRIKKARALVTGESIGQVSTQTLANLAALDTTIETMIIRPLIATVKDEIISLAKKIGTYEMAYKGAEFCAINTSQVETSTTRRKLAEALKDFDHSVLENAIHDRFETPSSEAVVSSVPKPAPVLNLPKDCTVIDLRTKDQAIENPIPGAESIPFDNAWNDFINWDNSLKYFLICNAGSKSSIMANFMKEEGFDAEHLPGGIMQYEKG